MKVAKPYNFYRTSLTSGSGYPDITAFHGEKYSLIELKDLVLGKRGDKKLRGLFKESQLPWYVNFFNQGGKRLFVAWRVCGHNGENKRYGLWKLDNVYLHYIDKLYYKTILNDYGYKEFSTAKALIEAVEKM